MSTVRRIVSSAFSGWEGSSSGFESEDLRVVPRTENCALQMPFNDNVRPLLDAVDKLRQLSVTDAGIKLPTIVVVGDQSSGKTSVLESLAQVSLPRGHGIATRVPLVLRLQNSAGTDRSHRVVIQYDNKERIIDEDSISDEVSLATNELAGDGKNIVDKPISLHITKPDAPDLTMVDLPGITRVPVDGQPEDIHEQIKRIILHYISPKETIILNVICSTVDFSTCESILMSRQVDKEGDRTTAVVTKVDMSPKDLREKVTKDAVGIGLGGYICVRNRVGEESHDEARIKEAAMFRTNPHLRDLPENMLGIRQLAKRLTELQASSLRQNLPKLVSSIQSALTETRRGLDALPNRVPDSQSALPQALDCFQRIRRSFEQLLSGDLAEFLEEKAMNYPARLNESFEELAKELSAIESKSSTNSRDLEALVREAKGVTLPNIPQASVLKQMVANYVQKCEYPCCEVVAKAHDYTEEVVMRVIKSKSEGYPKLHALLKKKMVAVLESSKTVCKTFVLRKLEKETSIVFTQNREYLDEVERKTKMALSSGGFDDGDGTSSSSPVMREMRYSLDSYVEVIKNRLCDEVPMELRYSLDRALLKEFEGEVMECLSVRDKLMELMAESSQLRSKRERFQQRLQVLEESNRTIQAATAAQ